MTYEEAKQTALDAMTDYPDQIKVTNYSGDGDEFTAISYSKKTKRDRDNKDWDMLISPRSIEYREYYEDLALNVVKNNIPKTVAIKQVSRGNLYEFLGQQVEYANLVREKHGKEK
jgi:hypothetical protein